MPTQHMHLKPLLLIDVDEVLIMDDGLKPKNAIEKNYRGLRIYLNPQHGEWLKELSKYYELTWCTSWEHDANAIVADAFMLPKLPVIEFTTGVSAFSNLVSTWKLPEVVKYVADRPCAWLDDDIQDDAYQWAHLRNISVAPTLLIKCKGDFTEEDFKSLLIFGLSLQNL